MKIKEETYEKYTYILISLDPTEDLAMLQEVRKKAEETSLKVNPKYLDGTICTKELKVINNTAGILAEEIVKLYLNFLMKKYKVNGEILKTEFKNYEEHRDIVIKINDKIKTLEVRSSFNYITSLANVLSGKFSLLGQYTTSYKNKEPEKDYYITVIYRYKNKEILEKLKEKNEVYIIGGGSKEEFEKIGKINTTKLKQTGSSYIIISPIKNARSVPELFKEIIS